MVESEEELNRLLMGVKEENEKAGLVSIFKKLRSWHLVPSLHGNAREEMETVTDFSFLGSKTMAVSDCHHEIKRSLLFGRKAMTNLDNILKSRDITLLTKVHIVKAIVCSIVMYRCESWTIKKAEHRRIDASELWCWRRLLRVP